MRHINSLQWGAIIVSVLVFGVIAVGLFISGSPAQERIRARDMNRTNDLGQIQAEITNYWSAKNSLPDSLDVLKDATRYVYVPNDPLTVQPYGYEKTGDKSFRLCADFEMMSAGAGGASRPKGFDSWEHAKGHVCFDRSIDPDFFPHNGFPQFKPAPPPVYPL